MTSGLSRLTIVGQGIAGTLLAWECERSGIPFQIHDAGHAGSASRIAAGIINPVAGRRMVRTWRIDELLPVARAAYAGLGAILGIECWREMRIRRLFRNDEERALFQRRFSAGSLGPQVAGAADEAGFWIEGAAAVDVGRLIAAARARWIRTGQLREEEFPEGRQGGEATVVRCTGAALRGLFPGGSDLSKGEIIDVGIAVPDPRVILNRGHWLLPDGGAAARVGATYVSDPVDTRPSASARRELEAAVRSFGHPDARVLRHDAALRLGLRDRRPVAGWLAPGLGVLGGLGSRGVLYAPWLAGQWRDHLVSGKPFDPETDAARLRADYRDE